MTYGAGHFVRYAYDPLGRRKSKTVNGATTAFLHDGDREIAEYDGAGVLLRRYVYGPGLDKPVVTVAAGGAKSWHHLDGLGSGIALSGTGGAVSERHAYGPYGEEAGLTGSALRFAGRRLDAETGLYHNRARTYAPALGRFLQPDPIGYQGGLNLYAYVGNDPLNLTDPMGTRAEPAGGSSQSANTWGLMAFMGDAEAYATVMTRAAAVGAEAATASVAAGVVTALYPKEANPRQVMYHYTNEEGMNGIVASQQIGPSLSANNPKDARYGDGVYLTDIQPGAKSNASLSAIFIRNPYQGERFTNYVAIDVEGLVVIQGRPHVYVVPTNGPLNISGGLVGSGVNQ